MNRLSVFTDYDEWNNVVMTTYNLDHVQIESKHIKLNLFHTKTILNKSILLTSPYAAEGGMLTKNSDNISLDEEFINEINTIYDEFKPEYILIKTRLPLAIQNEYSHHFFIDYSHYTFILDLTEGLDNVWNKKIKSKTRNQIRKGLKNILDIRIGYLEILEDFYKVLSTCWRDLGTPIHSIDFFRNILINFKEKSKLIVVYHKNRPVSSALLLIIGNTIHHPFAGTIKRYNHLAINNILYYKIIEYACFLNIKYFDMGRSRLGQGTYKYKESWGAKPLQLFYYYYRLKDKELLNPDSYYLKLAASMWKKMPLCIANNLGKYFIKRFS
jgi:predicted N-acyltransferase